MIRKTRILVTENTDPYHNLALEEALLHSIEPGLAIFYLWQNRNTVVIGRNQSAVDECRIDLLTEDGGKLARRLSGGGAVYHDLGNLNFTFLLPREDFDVNRQTEVILQALRALGIPAERNGRNDLTAAARKFSGHAYYHAGDRSYHHGTIMLQVDREKMARYLSVSSLKLAAKGVASVRSRVVNLCELQPSLTKEDLSAALMEAFSACYIPAETLAEEDLDTSLIRELQEKYASEAFRFGHFHPMERMLEARFSWGDVRLAYRAEEGRIRELSFASDGLAAEYLASVRDRLLGTALTEDALRTALTGGDEEAQMAEDIMKLILN